MHEKEVEQLLIESDIKSQQEEQKQTSQQMTMCKTTNPLKGNKANVT